MKTLKVFFIQSLIIVPSITAAQLTGTRSLLTQASNIISQVLIPLVFSLALLYFFYGIAKYIRASGEGDKAEGKQIMIWGVVALFVMSSVWGLVTFIRQEAGLQPVNNINIPTINSAGGGGGAASNATNQGVTSQQAIDCYQNGNC